VVEPVHAVRRAAMRATVARRVRDAPPATPRPGPHSSGIPAAGEGTPAGARECRGARGC
jgi:hypothetical protein